MKRKTIFITGPESSGSTFIARAVNKCFYTASLWNGRGFNCCNNRQCDSKNYYLYPCLSYDPVICHRSIPFGKQNKQVPPVKKWAEIYPNSLFVFCTRDPVIMKKSSNKKSGQEDTTSEQWIRKAESVLKDCPEDRLFIFSYESMLLLKEFYISRLYDFLDIPEEKRYMPADIKNGNAKYIK